LAVQAGGFLLNNSWVVSNPKRNTPLVEIEWMVAPRDCSVASIRRLNVYFGIRKLLFAAYFYPSGQLRVSGVAHHEQE
jgi:hypothetical protein